MEYAVLSSSAQTTSNLGFSENDFYSACQQLDSKQLDPSWTFFVASHDVEIYRHYNSKSGLYSYKVYGYLKDVRPETCAAVYMDLEYRKVWDSYVSELKEVRGDGADNLIYWRVAYPWPMSHRDYTYARELRVMDHNGQKKFVVLAKSVPCHSIKEHSGVIRVTDYLQSCALTTDGGSGAKAYMHYYDDPKGMLPTWLINWAAKTGVPQFLTQMQQACRGYDQYLQDGRPGGKKK